ncbi:hypothetical protein ACE6H2_003942 [Prunus campanulata]
MEGCDEEGVWSKSQTIVRWWINDHYLVGPGLRNFRLFEGLIGQGGAGVTLARKEEMGPDDHLFYVGV